MDKRIIKSIIIEKQEEIEQFEVLNRAIELESNANYVIVGIRRAGKSYQMFQDIKNKISSSQISNKDYLYINFEDERISSITCEELNQILESYFELYNNPKPLIYLDEIQNISGWEKFARRLADSKYRVVISGSNAQMLSKDIATTLGGRYIIKEVFPFSFSEYLLWNKVSLEKNWEYKQSIKTQVSILFDTYFHYGGFAESFPLKNKREWLNSLYLKILIGDIIARNNIRNNTTMRLLAKKIAESIMQPTSQARLLHIIKSSGSNLGRNTLSDYLTYMNDAYLTFNIVNFTDSLSDRISSCKRYYYDNGILNLFLFKAETHLLENMVAIELIKRYRQEECDGVYYYNKCVEVDFYIPDRYLAIQVSYSIADPITKEREVRALERLSEVYNIKQALIITRDEEDTINSNNLKIQVIPIYKWLLFNGID